MTFVPSIKTGKLSCYVLNCVSDQTVNTTSYIDVGITSSITTTVDQFSTTLTASASTDRVTLPAGKYYLDARLYVLRYPYTGSVWGAEYIFYEYSSSTKTAIGFEGREAGAVAIGDPQKSEHAVAYIESDGTTEIGLQVKAINSTSIIISSTTLANGAGQSRVMIWRIE
tara:strand:+ start:1902 stop:2408 length:507 start_codon:yes stop_codon:yes gene_type:complete